MSDSFVTPWTVAYKAPLSMEFSGNSTGVGCHFLLGHIPEPGIDPRSPALQADALLSKPPNRHIMNISV